ncbi:MAG TPA: ATP-binding protein [Opitutaceae bacterium]|nr:ATP-binding protein [Opitutaceae bacterium]
MSAERSPSPLSAASPGAAAQRDPAPDSARLVGELQAQRGELEMQIRTLRETQAQLEGAVHRYVDLYDSLPIGYVTLTREGRIVEANRAAGEWLGVPREGLAGALLGDFLLAADAPRLPAYLETCAASRESQLFEATLAATGSKPIEVQISGRRADATHSNEVLIGAALTNVSELKEAQRGLEEIVAEQENFAYSISHDLRAPLLTMRGFASMLLEDGVSFTSEQSREILGRINRAGARMDDLLLSLLNYTRVSRSDVPLGPMSLSEVVRDVLVQHRGSIAESRAQVDVEEPLPAAMGSTGLLGQVLGNLLTNALKYSAKDRTPVVRISARLTERTVILTVADNGIGIAPANHERIFRIFERLHGVSAYPGTGIGLALVRRAAERMNGRVWVESEEGRGAEFHLELPR